MLQHWASEGEFYIGGFVLLKFIELVTSCILYLHCIRRNITLGGYLDTCTVLDIKRVENAFFHSMYIFSVILHAIDKQDIST